MLLFFSSGLRLSLHAGIWVCMFMHIPIAPRTTPGSQTLQVYLLNTPSMGKEEKEGRSRIPKLMVLPRGIYLTKRQSE